MRTWTFSQAFFLLLFILSVLEGCKSNYSSESFIVIAVDRLGSDSIDCSKEPKNPNLPSSFEVLCRDFSRWSHVYTPSTLTVPALTSMMTGEYPFSHGVRNNGSNYLSANFETVAERAFRKGWSTLFISGGAPVLRKTGLGQGFEVFDDSIKPNLEIIHRPLQQTVPIFFSHLKEIGKQPLMAWIYVPDLLFDKLQTKNSMGELRNLSFESQLEQFDDELTKFFEQLKAQSKWENTNIIVVGLNSRTRSEHRNTSLHENLYSEGTQVSLFIKWAGNSAGVKHDENVSLVDIGTTLFEKVSGPLKDPPSTEFPSYSLSSSLRMNNPQEDRWIVLESAWSSWHRQREITKAFRSGPILCLQEERLKCFNSHTDRQEILPLSKTETAKIVFSPTIEKYFYESKSTAAEEKPYSPISLSESPCFQLIKTSRFLPNEMKRCEDSSILDLAQWMYEDQNPQSEIAQKEAAKKKFTRSLWYALLDQKIDETNLSIGELWDISPEKTSRRKLLEAILDLPEVAKFRTQAQRSFSIMREEPDRN